MFWIPEASSLSLFRMFWIPGASCILEVSLSPFSSNGIAKQRKAIHPWKHWESRRLRFYLIFFVCLSQQQCHNAGQQSWAVVKASFLSHFSEPFLFEWQHLITRSQKGLSQVQSQELERRAKQPTFYLGCLSVCDVSAIYLLQCERHQEGGERWWISDFTFVLFVKAH